MPTDDARQQVAGRQTPAPASAMPPPVLLYQLATGHYISRALFVVAKLGVADLLKDGPRHHTDLAKATGTHARSLNRVMRLLASAGVFHRRGRRQVCADRGRPVPTNQRAGIVARDGHAFLR